jgi:alpha,alpha-trehalase
MEKGLDKVSIEPYRQCLAYIDAYWPRITRAQPQDEGTLMGLPRPYICANHDMFKELYYWDSYFIILGLEHTPHEERIVDITENVMYLLNRFGRIPNGSRYYFLSRSQPPFMTSMIRKSISFMKRRGDSIEALDQWLLRAYTTARTEYLQVWRGKKFPDEREVYQGLSRYYDLNIWHLAAEAESGWDMTPRFEDRCLDFIPVDLNCLLLQYERDFVGITHRLGLHTETEHWKKCLTERIETMTSVLWDEDTGFFYDFDYHRHRRSNFRTVAGFFAMWCELATPEQASRLVQTHLPVFEQPHGVVTTEHYQAHPGEFSKQWAWPNGWAPLHWIVVSGLMKYGYHVEAHRIAKKWLDLVNSVFLTNGVNFEKYDVVQGRRAIPDRYPDQAGFAWTNAIFRRFTEFLDTGKLWQDGSENSFE